MCRTPARAFRPTSPTAVDLFMAMTWLAGQRDTALRAKTRAVRPAHRRKRQFQTDRIDDRLLEIDGFVDDASDLVFLGGLVGGAIRIGKQFGQGYLNATPHRAEATSTLADGRGGHGPGHQHAFGHRLDPQIQVQKGALVNRDQLQPDACGAVHGVMQLEHRSRSSPQPCDVDRHRRRHMSLRSGTVLPGHKRNPTAHATQIHAALGVGRRLILAPGEWC